MDIFHIVAEDKIKRAMKEGEFDNLPGKGKPLELDDLSSIPTELRMAYKIMKNAGMLDEEFARNELLQIEDLIEKTKDREEKEQLKRKLNEKLLQFNRFIDKKKTTNSAVFKQYDKKLHDKLLD
ncbi:DUF1992 domain-containing protein [Peribacillus alkalitolerans]|uniref:DnaJ family domain-containing protein n=1 Tax=Peribacillus alkalitolerans TaxID=1550385 RepID=UPI0013D3E290|nr:DUF1992 domain-containing protein [Peribacillus alkalitolerans]